MFFSLNQVTAPQLGFVEFLELAKRVGCDGVELRNDLNRSLFDGIDPGEAGAMARDLGLRVVALNHICAFNSWPPEQSPSARGLLEAAVACGAEAVSFTPRNDGIGCANGERQANLRIAIKTLLPLLKEVGMIGLIEPLGFMTSSLRSKAEAVAIIDTLDAKEHLKIVHNTFHHFLDGEGELFPDHTALVQISGVVNDTLTRSDMRDEHRVFVDEHDQLGTVEQISGLVAGGYRGPLSFECFSPDVQESDSIEEGLKGSIEFIASHLRATAA
ncbi:TIM barrel protein [Nioella aestuarii]|uniref:TIM barrel protein n=1 Tax=Nioella aestuarii TaxID=1662864 RepID=UPI003D7F55D6